MSSVTVLAKIIRNEEKSFSNDFHYLCRVKRHLRILILLVGLMILAGCNWQQREARRMVARAVALSDTAPDSTVRLIDSVLRMPVNFSERRRMDMALLQGEVLFRDVELDDDFDFLDSVATSPELERAAAYYAKKKQYAKAAHAALYSGYVQQHYNEKEAAMRSFKEAEQYGLLFRDSLSVAWADYQMGRMLVNNGMEKEATSILQTANLSFGNHYADKALVQNAIANCYILLGDYESAEHHLRLCLKYADKGCSPTIQAKALNNFSVLFRQKGEYNKALSFLNQAKTIMDDEGKLVISLNKATVFMAQREIDSAFYCFRYVEDGLCTTEVKTEIKASAYSAFSQFAESQGNYSDAYRYRGLYDHLLFNLMAEREQKSIYRIQQQYDYESLQNEMNKKIISRHRIILIISALLLVTTIVILFLQYKQKRLKEAEAELKSQIDAMKQDLRQTVKSSVMEKEIALRLRIMLTANHVKKKTKDPNNEWGTLVWQVMNGKDNLFDAAQATIETVYPDLYAIITESHPDLTKTEARLCLLSFTDLSNTEMAEILGLSLNTVNQNRSNLRKKLNLNSDKLKDQLRMTLSK